MDTVKYSKMNQIESSFTCLTCRVIFPDLQMHRAHYSSEWHRYNLLRKVAGLSSLTLEDFQQKYQTYHKNDVNQTKQNLNCKICRKKFNSEMQYQNHVASNKHKKMMEKTEETEEMEENKVDFSVNSADTESKMEVETNSYEGSWYTDEGLEELENPIERNDCLFCNHHSKCITRNLKHMMIEHSFFVPDPEHCIDHKGLLMYLGEKIFGDYKCIWCDNTGRKMRSAEAVKAHMIDKGHCKMRFEGSALLEYQQFYDYSISSDYLEESDSDMELPELSEEFMEDDGYELVLPSGKTVGHRELMRYYKQNLGAVTAPRKKCEKLRKIMLECRALGGSETQAKAAQIRARDMRYMQRIQSKYNTQLQFKQNKMQKHFRPQVNF